MGTIKLDNLSAKKDLLKHGHYVSDTDSLCARCMLHTLSVADSVQRIGSSFVRQFGEILKGSEDDGCLPRLINKKAWFTREREIS